MKLNKLPLGIYSIAFYLCFVSVNSYAIGLSAFRIYLDSDKPQTSFMIYNHDTQPQDCKLLLRHYTYDANGKMSEYKGTEPLPNSADDWIRFSPKRFVLTPANNQTVKFMMRRRANSEPDEYPSYVSLDCGAEVKIDKDGKKKSKLSVAPKLVHNLPIIVRTGKLNAQMTFSDINITNKSVEFTLNRSGSRSVYGDVQLIDKSSGEVISEAKTISIYPETTRVAKNLTLDGNNPKQLKLKFVEDKNYGGTITIEQDL